MSAKSNGSVLLVGAGGIGCELLKNLVYNGFNDITIVDLDTIDVSNLNRQFLFSKKHVGRSKAETARDNVLEFKPTAHIAAYHKSIFSSSFDSEFFGKFAVVFNALDNLAARKHVNRMCISAKIPLIESGTAGYLGQVEPLIPVVETSESEATNTEANQATTYRTGCYECQPRGLGQRHYPACTIRNTPSEPIHCVVWAKYLFNQLFGQPDVDDEDISPDFTDPSLHNHDRSQINDELLPAKNDLINKSDDVLNTDGTAIGNSVKPNQISLREWFHILWSSNENDQSNLENGKISSGAISLSWRLFHHDIVTLVSMRDLWVDRQDRREPSPLEKTTMKDALGKYSDELLDSTCVSELRDQRKLSTSGWLLIFLKSVDKLQKQVEDGGGDKYLVWDKLFHLPGADQLTRFIIKSLAGNIIPAVASTNAIVAGLMVLQARHILSKKFERIRSVYIHRRPTGRRGNHRLVVPVEPALPNPSCLVCSDSVRNSQLHLLCAPELLTLRILRDRILVRHLGMLAPDVEVPDRGIILISSEEDETDEETLNKTLADFKLTHGTCLQCDDFRQDFTIQLILSCISVELANALPNPSDSSTSTFTLNFNMDSRLTEQFNNEEQQSEIWRIVGDINSILSNSKDNTISEKNAEIENNENTDKFVHNNNVDTEDDLIEITEESMTTLNQDLENSVNNNNNNTSINSNSNKRKFLDTISCDDQDNMNRIKEKKLRFDKELTTLSSPIIVPVADDDDGDDDDDDDDLIIIE
ncbi:ubiquitin-like 1-activating enzyme E1 B [Schistosoma bovis]|uniref:Ubiquitin-like 1-activating enzyme E1 B n=1 Tax=Schistosoma bovis TaxID=6184 RepID=A0A430Q7W3_SCHBO|nr:ubiquitin-like 1-activating enzyme E1 B [Schistosoma bovis]